MCSVCDEASPNGLTAGPMWACAAAHRGGPNQAASIFFWAARGVGVNFEFIAKTVPAILIAGGILMLVFSLTRLGVDPAWGWALIIIGVLLYLLEHVPGLRRL